MKKTNKTKQFTKLKTIRQLIKNEKNNITINNKKT